MFIPLQVHVLVLIHDVGHLHGGGRSSGLHGTGSVTGVMPTSVALYPYCSGSGVVTAGVGACNPVIDLNSVVNINYLLTCMVSSILCQLLI